MDDNNIEQKSVIEISNKCNFDLFPNIFKLWKILIMLPVTLVEAERTFFTLLMINNYLKYSTSELRLNVLATLNYHFGIFITYEEIITTLVNSKCLDFILYLFFVFIKTLTFILSFIHFKTLLNFN